MNPRDVPVSGIRQLRFALATAALAAAIAVPAAQASTGATTAPGGTAPPPATQPTATTSGAPDWTVVQKATWYGGRTMWGRTTACGTVLTPATIGVANKNLPCGTQVTFTYGAATVTAPVIDRGPFRKGYAWDLTRRAARLIGFIPVGAGALTAAVTLPD